MRWPKFIFDVAHKRELTPPDYIRACISERFWDVTLDKIPATAAYKSVLSSYIKNLDQHLEAGNGLFLVGRHGSGKTGAALVAAKEFIARGGTALFLEEFKLVRNILDHVQFDASSNFRERMEDVHLLVVDDLGLASVSDNLHLTEEIIKYRFQRRRCVVITTNLTKSAFEARYPTIADGLKEACETVVCEGVAWRDDNQKGLSAQFK